MVKDLLQMPEKRCFMSLDLLALPNNLNPRNFNYRFIMDYSFFLLRSWLSKQEHGGDLQLQ